MKLKKLKKGEKGFTLIELLIALPIIAIVVAAATGALIQVIQSTSTSAHMVAIRQVQTAGYWVSKDGLQVQVAPDLTDPTGFPLTLRRTDRDDRDVHVVIYSFVSPGELTELQRQKIVTDKDGSLVSNTTTMVGQYIDSSQTRCQWDGSVLTFTVTAKVPGARGPQTESRTYEIKPRPD